MSSIKLTIDVVEMIDILKAFLPIVTSQKMAGHQREKKLATMQQSSCSHDFSQCPKYFYHGI